jgi:hypothetical protein
VELAHFIWKPVNYGVPGYTRILEREKDPSRPLVYNHFEGLRGLCTKTGLLEILKKFYETKGQSHVFEATPTSFIVTGAMNSSDWKDF